jgi:hypothetical protein
MEKLLEVIFRLILGTFVLLGLYIAYIVIILCLALLFG